MHSGSTKVVEVVEVESKSFSFSIVTGTSSVVVLLHSALY